MDKKLLLFILLSVAINTIAQNDRKPFFSSIYDELGVLPNAHIINLNTNKAAYSNENGEFKIFVKVNDSLKFTSVGYKTQLLTVKPSHLGMGQTRIFLQKEIVELNEVEVKKHDLTGSLALDFKQTPEDKKATALANTMDFSKINMKAETKDDYIDRHVRPHVVQTDPIGPANVIMSMPFGYSERLWALRKELAFKKGMPAKLLSELGEDFFFIDLKIPVDRYYHFLEYCNPLGIEKLYQERKLIEVIKMLRKEHIEYLRIIKKE